MRSVPRQGHCQSTAGSSPASGLSPIRICSRPDLDQISQLARGHRRRADRQQARFRENCHDCHREYD
jgi:hypothetical protein